MTETNLERLDRMFPGKLLLTPADTADALGWNRKKVYRIIDDKTFPIKPRRTGALIGIPKLALAKWLDGDDEGDGATPETPQRPQNAPETPKRGRGRPRGSSRQRKAAMVVVAEFKQRLAEVVGTRPAVLAVLDALKEAAAGRGV